MRDTDTPTWAGPIAAALLALALAAVAAVAIPDETIWKDVGSYKVTPAAARPAPTTTAR